MIGILSFLFFLDTFEHGKCRETGERQISLKNYFFSVSSHSGNVQQTFVDLLGRALKLGFYTNNLKNRDLFSPRGPYNDLVCITS